MYPTVVDDSLPFKVFHDDELVALSIVNEKLRAILSGIFVLWLLTFHDAAAIEVKSFTILFTY